MARIIHFEIPAKNPEKAVDFYKNVFGWEITNWGGPTEYWLIKTGEDSEPGIHGAIYRSNEKMNQTVNTIDVPDLDDYINKVKANGGNIISEKSKIPGVGDFIYAADKEGVVFGMLQSERK
jgi:predicted enzyme related to lactoylglutathione lyase